MRVHRRSTSSAGEAWVPSPPSAAPAAGGWGKPVSRRVFMVGLGRCPAGGASEAEVLLVRLLSAQIPSGGGVPWGFTDLRAIFPAPRPDPGMRWIWMQFNKRMIQRFFAAAPAFLAVVSSEAVLGDFPSAVWWAPAIQCLGSFSSGAPSSAPARRRRRDPEGFLVIFPLFLDLSVSSEN